MHFKSRFIGQREGQRYSDYFVKPHYRVPRGGAMPICVPPPRCDKLGPIRINLRTAGISRRGEGGWDVDGWALVVARRSPLPGLDIAAATCSPGRVPHPRAATRAPTLPNSSPAPTRDPSPDHFLFFCFSLGLMPIGCDKSGPYACLFTHN